MSGGPSGAATIPTTSTWTTRAAGGWPPSTYCVSVVAYADFTTDGGARAASQLIAEHPNIDALFVASDLMAVGALAVLAGAGRLVPGDVAVVGYDDLGAAATTSPPLTTIVNPVVAMARTAGEMLIDLLNGKKVDQAPVIFAPELVIRLST